MLTKVAAISNMLIGMLWLLSDVWMWLALGGFSGIFNSARAFFLTVFYLLPLVAGPLCLIVGSKMALSKRPLLLSPILNGIGLATMIGMLGPALYDNIHPAPLVFIDIRLTVVLATVISFTCVANFYLIGQFLKLRRQITKVMIDAA
jgi:hypothetical protein